MWSFVQQSDLMAQTGSKSDEGAMKIRDPPADDSDCELAHNENDWCGTLDAGCGGDIRREHDDAESLLKKKTVFRCEDRLIVADDAFVYLSAIDEFEEGVSVFTSMPDISEIPSLFHGYLVKEYKEWFTNAAYQILSRLAVGAYAIFLQSDVRMMNSKSLVYEWIDKSHLISTAAEKTHCNLIWHKMVHIYYYCTIHRVK
jgi:hypothetical protein